MYGASTSFIRTSWVVVVIGKRDVVVAAAYKASIPSLAYLIVSILVKTSLQSIATRRYLIVVSLFRRVR